MVLPKKLNDSNSLAHTIRNQIEISEDGTQIVRIHAAAPYDINVLFYISSLTATHQVSIHPDLVKQIDTNAIVLSQLDIELGRNQLIQILLSEKPSIGFEWMRLFGLLEVVLPELYEGYKVWQNEFHSYDVYYHSIYSCDNAVDRLEIRLAALFHDIGKPRSRRLLSANSTEEEKTTFYNHEQISVYLARRIFKRFQFDKKLSEHVLHLIRYHMFHYTYEWTNSAVRRLIRNVGKENLLDLFALRHADRLGSGKKEGPSKRLEQLRHHIESLIHQEEQLKITDLDINGHDLMSRFQLKPSPIIGTILNHLYQQVLDNPDDNNHHRLMELAEAYVNQLNQPS